MNVFVGVEGGKSHRVMVDILSDNESSSLGAPRYRSISVSKVLYSSHPGSGGSTGKQEKWQ